MPTDLLIYLENDFSTIYSPVVYYNNIDCLFPSIIKDNILVS